jgi:hypothetical protein
MDGIKMRKLLAVGLLAMAGSVQAADWVLLGTDNKNANIYLDKDSILFDKYTNSVTVWDKRDNYSQYDESTGKIEVLNKSKIKVFCELRKISVLSVVNYDERGDITRSVDEYGATLNNPIRYGDVIPESVAEAKFNAVCTRPGFITKSNPNTDFDLIDKLLSNPKNNTSSNASAAAADAATAAVNQAAYDNLVGQAYDIFMARPENSVFVEGTQAWNILDQQVQQVAAELGNKLMPIEVFNLARSRTAKLISIPPLPSQKKTAKPSIPQKAQSSNKNTVFL